MTASLTNNFEWNCHRFQVNKNVARFLQAKHPWIHRRQCSSALSALPIGSLVRIVGPENRFLAFGIYEPLSITAIRVFSFDDVTINKEFFKQKLLQKWMERKNNADQYGTNGFRWIHGEADGFPGINIDVYNKTAVCVFYISAWQQYLENVFAELGRELGLKNFYCRNKTEKNQIKSETLLHDFLQGQKVSVLEPVWFAEESQDYPSFPLTGQKTGFYLDLREVRRSIRSLKLAKAHVLNLFASSGVLSGLSEKQGATKIISVESGVFCARQFEDLKKFWELDAKKQEWISQDVWKFLDSEFYKSLKPFDLVIFDPPSLAKKNDASQKLSAIWENLLKKILPKLKNEGHLFTICCTERMTPEVHVDATKRAAQKLGMVLRLVQKLPAPFDHPVDAKFKERDYFHAFHWQRFDRDAP